MPSIIILGKRFDIENDCAKLAARINVYIIAILGFVNVLLSLIPSSRLNW